MDTQRQEGGVGLRRWDYLDVADQGGRHRGLLLAEWGRPTPRPTAESAAASALLGALSSSVPLSSTKKRLATLRLSAPSPAHHKGLEKSKGPHGRHALRAIGARRIG